MPAHRLPLRARQLRGADHDANLGPAQLHHRNRCWLEAMAASGDEAERIWWRNALVEHNLGLVKLVAQRHSRSSGQPFDELVSAGCLGLIRAVEAFDLRQRCTLSSFAVPYIKGSMLHDVRDHGQPLHTPRRLRELQQRARRLQEQRRGQGLKPLGSQALAAELGCSTSQLEDAAAVQRALQVRSLDAPLLGSDGEEAGCLLDQLAAQPSSLGATDWSTWGLGDPGAEVGGLTGAGQVGDGLARHAVARGALSEGSVGICETGCATTQNGRFSKTRAGSTVPGPAASVTSSAAAQATATDAEQWLWLRAQLSELDLRQQRLLLGHWVEGLSWSALALELQISSRQARSRGEALLAWLQEAAGSDRTTGANAMASAAAMAV
jgi:RNA polymerase sigma factor (sigma-70 family)